AHPHQYNLNFNLNSDSSSSAEWFYQCITTFLHARPGFFPRRNRQNHDLSGCNTRRQNNSIVVAVHHHNSANEPRTYAPASGPTEFLFAFAILKLDPAGAREVLAEKMRGSGLDRFAVLHHRFDRQRLHRTGKTFTLGFFTSENRHREMLARKSLVKIEN